MKLPAAVACGALVACAMAFGQNPVRGSEKLTSGERAFQKCYSCHALEAGLIVSGPTLHRVIGRKIAAEPGFRYSPPMRRFAAENPLWTKDLLDRFVADPEAVVPGTTMSFIGIRDQKERAVLIAYLGAQESR